MSMQREAEIMYMYYVERYSFRSPSVCMSHVYNSLPDVVRGEKNFRKYVQLLRTFLYYWIPEYLWYLCVIFQYIVLYLCFAVFTECDLFLCGIFNFNGNFDYFTACSVHTHPFLGPSSILPSFSRLFYKIIASHRWSTFSAVRALFRL